MTDRAKARLELMWTALTACMWIYMAVASYGAGERYGPLLAFLGMLVWATDKRDWTTLCAIQRETAGLVKTAVDGWQEAQRMAREGADRCEQLLRIIK